jgi:hypothetical protein
MAAPIADVIGDYRAFTALQRGRLAARGIDIAPYELSHLSRLGSEPRTRGPRLCPAAVHGGILGHTVWVPVSAFVHLSHGVAPGVTVVAGRWLSEHEPCIRPTRGPQPSAGGMLALNRRRLDGSKRRFSCRSRCQVSDGNAAATRAAV